MVTNVWNAIKNIEKNICSCKIIIQRQSIFYSHIYIYIYLYIYIYIYICKNNYILKIIISMPLICVGESRENDQFVFTAIADTLNIPTAFFLYVLMVWV